MQYLDNIIKATISFDNKEISIQDWVSIVLGEEWRNIYSCEYCRRAEKIFSIFVNKLEENRIEEITDKNILSNIKKAKIELEKERIKLSDEKREFNAEYRNQSRDELFLERLEKAIEKLNPIEINSPILLKENKKTTGVLVISDLHFDSTYVLYGAYNEIINKYDKEICKERMINLISLIDADNILIDELLVVFDGDLLEGVLRASSLIKLTQPVVDSTLEVSEFLSWWIMELQQKINVPLKVAIVGGNHSILRPLMSKPIDERENLEKIIHKFIELRLKNQPNIKIEPYGDAYFISLYQNNILFLHGEDCDLEKTINYYENYYGINLDYCIAGHYHSGESKTVGVGNIANKEVIRVPSICGTDIFAKKIRKNTRAGASFMLFNNNGRDWSKNYCLN